MLEKIRAEIEQEFIDIGMDGTYEWNIIQEAFDKYAEQEPCEDCDYSEIMDWEQDAKTGKAKPIYWCERHKEPCDDAEQIDYHDDFETALRKIHDYEERQKQNAEPCDVVSRQAVLDLIEHYNSDGLGSVFYGYEQGVKFANAVNKLPSVRPQEQTGHWIKKDGYSDCSECGSHIVTEWDYCPNCGCAMKGELE